MCSDAGHILPNSGYGWKLTLQNSGYGWKLTPKVVLFLRKNTDSKINQKFQEA